VGSSRINRSAGSCKPGDQDAGLLAAGEPADGHLELLGPEQKALGPGRHVDRAALDLQGVALGGERPPQRHRGIEGGAALVEAGDAQPLGVLDPARVGRQRAGEQPEQRRLAAAVFADDADARAGADDEVEIADQQSAAE
jgi:hypothetical protein